MSFLKDLWAACAYTDGDNMICEAWLINVGLWTSCSVAGRHHFAEDWWAITSNYDELEEG